VHKKCIYKRVTGKRKKTTQPPNNEQTKNKILTLKLN